jgi:ADP-ribose pyrophosphatase YjhB (NUDIX family)
MTTILCADPHGLMIPVAEDDILFRPVVYGILIENNQILLQRNPVSFLWQPPGGVVLDGETPKQALRQHVRLATGIIPQIETTLFIESSYRVDSEECAWHDSMLYFSLRRSMVGFAGLVDFDNVVRPEWVSVNQLRREQMQFGFDAIEAGRTRLGIVFN